MEEKTDSEGRDTEINHETKSIEEIENG